jgi:Sulfotransferase family
MTGTGPVLIAGPDRSGTTLLYAIMGSHSRIAMVRRTNVWRFFYRRYGDLADPANLDRCLQELVTYRRVARLEPDAEAIRLRFAEGPKTYGRLFSLLLEQVAEREGKPRWGDKSLHTEHHAKEVFTEFPDARIVHMLRDPRDRYSSAIKRHGRDVHRVAAATGRWLLSTRAGFRDQQRWPDRYRVVRYEDLCREPERVVREVCAFYEEEYEPAMLLMGAEPEHRDAGGNSSFGDIEPGTISTKGIGRYRTGLSAMERRFVEAMAGPLMSAVGYAPDRPSLAGHRLRYYGWFLPVNALRMVGWMTIARIMVRRGRRVPPNPEPASTPGSAEVTGGV